MASTSPLPLTAHRQSQHILIRAQPSRFGRIMWSLSSSDRVWSWSTQSPPTNPPDLAVNHDAPPRFYIIKQQQLIKTNLVKAMNINQCDKIYLNWQKPCHRAHVPSGNKRGEGLMSYLAANHQGRPDVLMMTSVTVMSNILTCSQL